MLALDLDGPILLPDGTVTERTIRAIHAAVDAGYRICVATGRNYTESRPTIERLNIRDECVFVGGANGGRHCHRSHTASDCDGSEIAAEVCRLFESLGHARWLQDTCETGLDYLVTGDMPVGGL